MKTVGKVFNNAECRNAECRNATAAGNNNPSTASGPLTGEARLGAAPTPSSEGEGKSRGTQPKKGKDK